MVEEECSFASGVLQLLEDNNTTIFSPFGTFLINTPCERDDIDESLENLTSEMTNSPEDDGTDSLTHMGMEARIDIEDACRSCL